MQAKWRLPDTETTTSVAIDLFVESWLSANRLRYQSSFVACLRRGRFAQIGTDANPMIVKLGAAVNVDGWHVTLDAVRLRRNWTALGIRCVMTTQATIDVMSRVA